MKSQSFPQVVLLLGIALCLAIYWPGLDGGFLFDDYPNIVNNTPVHVETLSLSAWFEAAFSSPASIFKRPLSMLSFTANYWASGLNPFWMKLTNLLLHILNGILLFVVLRLLLGLWKEKQPTASAPENTELFASLVAALWLITPINFTGVLYVVQRMEILAQTFVLVGLWCYLCGRQRIFNGQEPLGYFLIFTGTIAGTILGLAAKETAVLLPAYILAIEICILRFTNHAGQLNKTLAIALCSIVIVPGLLGMAWLLPGIMSGASFSGRDFTVFERLLTESRIVLHYLYWTLFPTPESLSFYHDDIRLSTGWLQPPSTLVATSILIGLAGSAVITLKKMPLYAFGIILFFLSHSLTATILPLELVFEHRNYFASIGVLISALTLLALPISRVSRTIWITAICTYIFWLSSVTLIRSLEWSHPVNFAYSEAARHPESPRAQYELGRALVIASDHNSQSPLFKQAKQAFTTAMKLPRSSILPELALITLDARSDHYPRRELWASIYEKLDRRPPRKEELTAIRLFISCQIRGFCLHLPGETVHVVLSVLPKRQDIYLLSDYAYYAAYVLNDQTLAQRVAHEVIDRSEGDEEIINMMDQLLGATDSSNN